MLNIEAPWFTYFKEIYNLFEKDPELTVDSELTEKDDGNYEFMIASKNGDKLNAIERLLGYGRVFGAIKVFIKYGYENVKDEDWAEVYRKAFEGNPYFQEVAEYQLPMFGTSTYAIFKKDIITFYNDNLGDYHGNDHYIVADLVKDIITDQNIYICTANE